MKFSDITISQGLTLITGAKGSGKRTLLFTQALQLIENHSIVFATSHSYFVGEEVCLRAGKYGIEGTISDLKKLDESMFHPASLEDLHFHCRNSKCEYLFIESIEKIPLSQVSIFMLSHYAWENDISIIISTEIPSGSAIIDRRELPILKKLIFRSELYDLSDTLYFLTKSERKSKIIAIKQSTNSWSRSTTIK